MAKKKSTSRALSAATAKKAPKQGKGGGTLEKLTQPPTTGKHEKNLPGGAYRTADGVERKRLTLYLKEGDLKELKRRALDEGYDKRLSDFVAELVRNS